MTRVLWLLRSSSFALWVVGLLAVYCGVAAWLPWSLPSGKSTPEWAVASGLDHPFSAPGFLTGCALLFASTLSCTWGRRTRLAALLRGARPDKAVELPLKAGADCGTFLRAHGFRGEGRTRVWHRIALWGGWTMHVGLLVLIAGVAVQQAFHDGGAFDLAQGETIDLASSGVLISRDRGPLASARPPELSVTLDAFDPFLHQQGYAPDRRSRLLVSSTGGTPVPVELDRAAGVGIGSATVYQAIPTGLALNLQVPGMGVRSLHLRGESNFVARSDVRDPSGKRAHFVVVSERELLDPAGTGALTVEFVGASGSQAVAPGIPFEFGNVRARLISITRWGRFTYTRSPGVPAVLAGFVVVLLGSGLMVFPAGVAQVATPGENAAGWVFVTRGVEALAAEWDAWRGAGDDPASASG